MGTLAFFLSTSCFYNYSDTDGRLAETWPLPGTNVVSHRQGATHPNVTSMGKKALWV